MSPWLTDTKSEDSPYQKMLIKNRNINFSLNEIESIEQIVDFPLQINMEKAKNNEFFLVVPNSNVENENSEEDSENENLCEYYLLN